MPKFVLIPMYILIFGVIYLVSQPIRFSVGYESTTDISIQNTLFFISILWTASLFFHLTEYAAMLKRQTFFTNAIIIKVFNGLRVSFLFVATVIFSKSSNHEWEFFTLVNALNPVNYIVTLFEIWSANKIFYTAYYFLIVGVALLPYVDFNEGPEREDYEVIPDTVFGKVWFLSIILLIIGALTDMF
ncbi:TPA: hypothetical protein ACGSUT_004402 [Vibrio parahaemolyticus]